MRGPLFRAFCEGWRSSVKGEFYKSEPLLQPVMYRLYQGSIGGVLGQLPEHRSGQPFCLEITHLERNRRWIVVRPVSAAVEQPRLLRYRIAELLVAPHDLHNMSIGASVLIWSSGLVETIVHVGNASPVVGVKG